MERWQISGRMAVSHVLHMNGGYGDTSYARNSEIQKKIISIAKPITQEAIADLCGTIWPKSLGIADLGCSSGPNSLLVISEIIDFIDQKCAFLNCPWPELQVPPELEKGAYPPLNRGKIFISKTCPRSVFKSYLEQFQRDFSSFLMSRSDEVIPGGRMVLSLVGRKDTDPSSEESCHQWELLAQALNEMVLEGLIEEERVDSFNVPYFSPSLDELTSEIRKQGSFIIDHIEAFKVDWDAGVLDNSFSSGRQSGAANLITRGQRVSKTIRAVVESMLVDHFGEDAMDDLFQRYSKTVDERLSKGAGKYVNVVMSLIRKPKEEALRK